MTDDEREREIERIAEGFSRNVGAALRFVLTIQAALNDATPAQRTRLRKRMPPLIEQFRETGDPAPIRRLIREVLGADWRPTGEAAEYINRMEDPG